MPVINPMVFYLMSVVGALKDFLFFVGVGALILPVIYAFVVFADKDDFVSAFRRVKKILVIGLGNREVTPDALGPKVIDQLFITRHLLEEFGKYMVELEECCSISGIVPGVMAQTGMETVEILQGVVAQTKPDIVIAVDALAARSIKRLNRTIQITDTGIIPGSGVGNYRNAITKEHLGIPVIAVGIPTVVDAATIVADFCTGLMENKQELEEMEETVRGMIPPKLNAMYVTSKDIDEAVNRLSYTISEGLNMTFVPKM